MQDNKKTMTDEQKQTPAMPEKDVASKGGKAESQQENSDFTETTEDTNRRDTEYEDQP